VGFYWRCSPRAQQYYAGSSGFSACNSNPAESGACLAGKIPLICRRRLRSKLTFLVSQGLAQLYEKQGTTGELQSVYNELRKIFAK